MTSLLERFDSLFLNLEIPVDDCVKHRNTFSLFSYDMLLPRQTSYDKITRKNA